MLISEEKIKKLILEIFSIFNYECILTGSCADYFHTGYSNIEDIDATIDCDIYDKYINANHPYKENLKLLLKLKHKIDGHIIYRYLYKDTYNFDIFSKTKNLIDTDIINLKLEDKIIKVFSANIRLYQLKTNKYRANLSGEMLQKKLDKVNERVLLYNNL